LILLEKDPEKNLDWRFQEGGVVKMTARRDRGFAVFGVGLVFLACVYGTS